MIGEPRDRTAYSLAIAGLGLTLALLITGICWIAVEPGDSVKTVTHHCSLGHCRSKEIVHPPLDRPGVPRELWIALAVLGGVLVGTLIPFPSPDALSSWSGIWAPAFTLICIAAVVFFVFSACDVRSSSIVWYAIGATLLGLLIPSPARRE
jgi:hypothetical protein